MEKATMIIESLPGMQGEVAIFKLEPAYKDDDEWADIETVEYVAISTIGMAFDTGRPETYIFPADVEGNIISWGELKGSFQGGGKDLVEDRKKALNGLGYEADRWM